MTSCLEERRTSAGELPTALSASVERLTHHPPRSSFTPHGVDYEVFSAASAIEQNGAQWISDGCYAFMFESCRGFTLTDYAVHRSGTIHYHEVSPSVKGPAPRTLTDCSLPSARHVGPSRVRVHRAPRRGQRPPRSARSSSYRQEQRDQGQPGSRNAQGHRWKGTRDQRSLNRCVFRFDGG